MKEVTAYQAIDDATYEALKRRANAEDPADAADGSALVLTLNYCLKLGIEMYLERDDPSEPETPR